MRERGRTMGGCCDRVQVNNSIALLVDRIWIGSVRSVGSMLSKMSLFQGF